MPQNNKRGARITKYDLELVEVSKVFSRAAKEHPESRAILEKYGFSKEEQERGEVLVRGAEKSFEWERQGRAYNFLSPTAERRVQEAKDWYADTRRRHARACLRRAEEAAGWVGQGEAKRWPVAKKLTIGTLRGLLEVKQIASFTKLREHRAELRADIARAKAPKPADAPPPKDTALVELAGWYERWRLLAQRVFRQRPDLMAPYGLTPGKAPPRLRGKEAAKYGERAAGSLGGTVVEIDQDDDESPEAPLPALDPDRQRLPLVH